MGRFHRHDTEHTHADGTVHSHGDGTVHSHEPHTHEHSYDLAAVETTQRASGEVSGSEFGDMSAYDTGSERIDVLEAIFTENDRRADINRSLFTENGVVAVNLMSSPGSGKTSILKVTLDALDGEVPVGIIEGDIATDLDAAQLAGRGAQVSLLNTNNGFGGECHLDAPMVNRALQGLDLSQIDLVVIENVGNLVCPAEFDVGEHAKAMVYAVTEGEDKPFKYPVMFRSVDVVLLNKIDLLPHLDVSLDAYRDALRQVNPAARVIPVSAKTGEGIDAWIEWLRTISSQT
ncbi:MULTISPECIES: hydrogenase nickel incorporation protein HypB [unclassified Gordonia (in: high G+C Gram-positive bacteria)]|uniref:hydrogenase nickel incorporation protein HypB n=1 Tax=unclassified Gordonia (in: high G+C Gram-positive bacteria) TaxID=2657482 RepID=UPI0009AEBD27|nr:MULTISPECIES: hydrogenase nickel incorporation protein HypB [unclassified Gordonia (in: high G+C Gram-positive bacteria)]MDF3281679.1 hydrogenase nickel incorporation protein HypB [Gordonia sp. N1V]OPX07342.1 hydrogenase accessory protein HypB [Gordonia sp. i37]